MLADGFKQTRLTENFAADTDPSCSPSGNQIAYTSARDGNKEVYVMNLNGSAQQRLTTNDASDGRRMVT
jgi:TolB protein